MSLYFAYSESYYPKAGEQYKKRDAAITDPDTFENTEIGLKMKLILILSLQQTTLIVKM